MIIRKLAPGFLLVLSVLGSDLHAQKLSSDEREILWHQDQRSLHDSVLYRYLSHKESKLRKLAAIALANIQDSVTVPWLIPLLKDRSSDVRASAAFALGQIGSAAAENDLAERLRQESIASVIARLLEALGKSGSSKVYDDVVAFGLPNKYAALKADQAHSIARFALRDIKSERGVWFCFDALEEPDGRTQWSALYALWRMAPHGAIDIELAKRKDRLEKLCVERNPDIRMNLTTLLGKIRSSEARNLLALILKNEYRRGRGDWRVQVNLAKAFAAHAGRDDAALEALAGLLDVQNDHVQITALSSFTGIPRETLKKHKNYEKVKKRILQLASPSKYRTEPVNGEAYVTVARHFPSDFEYASRVTNLKVSNYLRSRAIEALCQIPSPENLVAVLDRLEDDSTRVAMAAWDFVRKLLASQSLRIIRKDTALANSLGETLFRKVKGALLREDMAITTLVAKSLGDSSVYAILRAEGYGERAIEELMLAYGKLSSPNEVEAMQAVLATLGAIGDDRTVPILERAVMDPDRTVALAAVAALKRITGMDLTNEIVRSTKPLYTDYDWKTLESISARLQAEIKTEKGTIVIRFHKNGAPFTVLNFYKLIRKKFFDGLTFHRVVPNFVIQGGDPRGDGWGGPNYAVRSEFALLGYGRGEVGVASAGKDTEGCQFFITHSPQPHLDGRYTIFASVVSGQNIADLIQVGDKILSVRLK